MPKWIQVGVLAGILAGGGRVLPPESGPLLQEAFGRADGLELQDAKIDRDHVRATVCESADLKECFRVKLTDPDETCDGERAGPWCVSFLDGRPEERLAAAMMSALSADEGKPVWVELAGDPDVPFGARPYLVALAVIAVPLLIGLAIGWAIRLARRRRFDSRWAVAALLLVPVLVAVLLPPGFLKLGFWDLLMVLVLLGLGLLLGSHRVTLRLKGRRLLFGAVAALLALVILETGARLLLPRPPGFPPAGQATLFQPPWYVFPLEKEHCTGALYPDRNPRLFEKRTRLADAASAHKRVLHVGDSMVEGAGVPWEKTFAGVLSSREPGAAHINAGVAGSAPDFYYLLVKAWLEKMRMDLVVVHVFMGNDLGDMDFPYACCRDAPLLEYGPQGPRPRCLEPDWGNTTSLPRLSSPLPYPLRVATQFSAVARHLCGLHWQLVARGSKQTDQEVAFQHFESVFSAMKEEVEKKQALLAVVLLPLRDCLEESPPEIPQCQSSTRNRMHEIFGRLGIFVLDARELFAPLVAREGGRRWFLKTRPGEVHFSIEGHDRLAGWLLSNLPGRQREGGSLPPENSAGDGP